MQSWQPQKKDSGGDECSAGGNAVFRHNRNKYQTRLSREKNNAASKKRSARNWNCVINIKYGSKNTSRCGPKVMG